MKRLFIGAVILLFFFGANAQDLLKGTITEVGTNDKLSNVFIHDNNSKQVTLADKDGKFEIKTGTGHLLIFNSPGYLSDTLYVVNMKPKNVQLRPLTVRLRQVTINSSRTEFNPRVEYAEVYQKSKVYIFSPSTWFSKEAKNARRLKRYFNTEIQERYVDEAFNAAYIGSIVPLKGVELENFMTMYRPTYAFLQKNAGPSLVAYISDSYKEYMALPPAKRIAQNLTDSVQK